MDLKWDWVAVLGLGNMGSAMARRLLEVKVAGEVVVWNRTHSKSEELRDLGAVPARDLAEVVSLFKSKESMQERKSLHLMFTGDEATTGVLTQLVELGLTDATIVCHATISSAAAKRCQQICQQSWNHYIAAPVTGRPPQARAGKLVIWLSCTQETVPVMMKQQAEILPALSRSAYVISETDVTAGTAYKSITNFILYASAEMFAETIVMFQKNNIDDARLLDWVQEFAAESILAQYARRIVQRDYNAQGGAGLDIAVKDLGLIQGLVPGSQLPFLAATMEHMRSQRDRVGDQDDWCAMAEEVKRRYL